MKLMLHRPLDLSQRVKVSLMPPDSGIYEHHVSFPAWSNVCKLRNIDSQRIYGAAVCVNPVSS